MNSSKILVAFDFDHTIVDCNSDVKFENVAANYILPDDVVCLKNMRKGSWTRYMGEIFKLLHKNNLTEVDYMKFLSELPLVQGMKELLLEMHSCGDYKLIIISDANVYFVEFILKTHGLENVISEIFTNPAEFDKDGCLQIQKFEDQNLCNRCPSNLCKGSVLVKYLEYQRTQGVNFIRVLFIGDGQNDVCPSLKLGDSDFIFARKGYRLLKSLEKMSSKDIQAALHGWDNGYDIKNICFINKFIVS